MKNTKVGYVRIVNPATGESNTLAYKELYEDESKLERLRYYCEKKELELYCACQEENTVPLIITKNGVIRVAHNRTQELHLDTCPKSIYYESHLRDKIKGISIDPDNEQRTFRIDMPSVIKSHSVSKSSSSKKASIPDPSKKKAGIISLVSYVNKLAWEKQTFSIKKQIKELIQSRQPVEWSYRDKDKFLRLFFGVSNDIQVKYSDGVTSLYDICYQVESFLKRDFTARYFFCAEIVGISEYKESRRFQYVTLNMRSEKSKNKAVVRIPTKDFATLFFDEEGELIETPNGMYRMLAGYCNKTAYRDQIQDMDVNWINVLKCATFYVNEYGLICKNRVAYQLYDKFIKENILFTVPYEPVANLEDIPDAVIEHKNEPDEVYIIAESDSDYKKKLSIYEEIKEYRVHVIRTVEHLPLSDIK